MSDIIRSKVARVLSSRELVIAAGKTQGVRVGMYFDVVEAEFEEINDPDTGELLGFIDRPKLRVKITRVDERFSVASSYKIKNVKIRGLDDELLNLSPLGRALMAPEFVTKVETLETTEQTWENRSGLDNNIRTGDSVVQVVEKIDSDEPEDIPEAFDYREAMDTANALAG